MNARSALYWTATSFIALLFISGGVMHVAGVDASVRGIVALGYPASLVGILGAWKVLGGLAIFAPRLPRLKEWAYAGIAFELSGAAVSHLAVSDPAWRVAVPLVLLAIAAASWALRPEDRVIATGS